MTDVPKVRRTIPAPFQRPSITIGGTTGLKREWRHRLACDLVSGDTVPGVGIVDSVVEDVDFEGRVWTITVTGGEANTKVFKGTDTVWVFCTGARP